jgi:plastocyanin
VIAPARAAFAAQTFRVSAGSESAGGDIQLNEFAPNQVAINVGDTVMWSLDSTEFHDIVFLSGAPAPEFVQVAPDGVFVNPKAAFPMGGPSYDGTGYVGSGLLNTGQTFSLTFTKAGTFPYLCLIHAGMGGTVKVVDSGQVDTQAAIDARKMAQTTADLVAAIPSIFANVGELPTTGATVGVAAGIESGQADIQRFLPRKVTIHQGETVSWIWKTMFTPHTVTFLGGQPMPPVIVPLPQPDGPPRLMLGQMMLAPAGAAISWNGGTYLNSGFLQPRPGTPAPQFSATFASTGTFDYLCLLHAGMTGTVVVLKPDPD